MSNNVFPGQHVTTTTVTSTETQVNPMIRFDRSYLNTLSGQLKLLEIVSAFIFLLGPCIRLKYSFGIFYIVILVGISNEVKSDTYHQDKLFFLSTSYK